VFFLVLLPILGEIVCRKIGIEPQVAPFYLAPANFFRPDSTLGWENGVGTYTVFKTADHTKLFEFSTDREGDHITSIPGTIMTPHKGSIYLYGCSYTFGFSVPDSATMGYKLQSLLPEYRVVNKGVPGYGLAQMYLSLQKSVAKGDTPTIAVFNYIDFHDTRTPLCKDVSSSMCVAVTQSKTHRFDNAYYPYYSLVKDSLKLFHTLFPDLTHHWVGTDRSSFLMLINQIYMYFKDEGDFTFFHRISLETAVDMMNYCKTNHITAVFANLRETREIPRTTDIMDTLKSHGFYTLDYSTDIAPHQYTAPNDPGHPSCQAHTIFARRIYETLMKHQLIN
jgi:hypothetical protein